MSRFVLRFVLLGLGLLALAPAGALADWTEVAPSPSPLNNDSTRNGEEPRITEIGGLPYVAWTEDTTQPNSGSSSQVRVARLAADGQSWTKIGNTGSHPISFLASTSSHEADITGVNGVPWVTWAEGFGANNAEIRAARYDAGTDTWSRIPDTTRPINHLRVNPGGNAAHPTIDAGTTGRPFISFFEADPGTGSVFFPNSETARVYVMQLNAAGDDWVEVGGGPVSDIASDAAFPRMEVIGDTPYLAYFQVVITQSGPEIQIRAARLADDGASWVQLPNVVAGGPSDYSAPDITEVGGVPYVATSHNTGQNQNQVEVFRLNGAGDAWEMVGGGAATPAGINAEDPSLEELGGIPWLTWRSRGGGGPSQGQPAVVSRFFGGEWVTVGSPVSSEDPDLPQAQVQVAPDLASINGIPWLAYGEYDGQTQGGQGVPGCCTQEHVSRLEPTFTSIFAQAESTRAVLVAEADTFGLPYPIGFEYGPRPTFTNQTTPEAGAAEESVTVIQEIEDLQPSTLYSFRPFATAGVPQPPVIGPSNIFLTESAVVEPPPPAADELFTYFTDVPNRWNRGRKIYLRFFVSDDADITVRIRRKGEVVRTLSKSVQRGRRGIQWNGRVAGRYADPGLYRLTLTADSGDQTANDRNWVRIVLPRRR